MNRYLPIMAALIVLPAPVWASRPCSMDAMSAAEKDRMVSEYARRLRVDGKASANAWANEQGNLFRRKLVAEGVCPPLSGQGRQAARRAPSTGKRQLLDKQGKRCTHMTVENQVFPSFGGAPMTMGPVPVCAD